MPDFSQLNQCIFRRSIFTVQLGPIGLQDALFLLILAGNSTVGQPRRRVPQKGEGGEKWEEGAFRGSPH